MRGLRFLWFVAAMGDVPSITGAKKSGRQSQSFNGLLTERGTRA